MKDDGADEVELLMNFWKLTSKFENLDRREMRRASLSSAACGNSASSVKATLRGVCKYTPCGSASRPCWPTLTPSHCSREFWNSSSCADRWPCLLRKASLCSRKASVDGQNPNICALQGSLTGANLKIWRILAFEELLQSIWSIWCPEAEMIIYWSYDDQRIFDRKS